MNRTLVKTAFTLGLAAIGFSLGALVAGEFVVRPGDGMTGGPVVLLFALGGLLLFVVVGSLLASRANSTSLPRAAALSLFLGVLIFGVTVWRGQSRREAQHVATGGDIPQVDSQGNSVVPPLPAAGTPDSLIGLVTATTDSLPRFETKGIDYETLGIAVYRSQGNWWLVGLKNGGRAWLNTSVTGRFFPVSELVVNRLNYLTPSWDSRIRDNNDASAAARDLVVKKESGEVPAKVLEASTASGSLMFKVEIFERSPCETTGAPKVIATGWVSAWANDGQPNVWFYSRGC